LLMLVLNPLRFAAEPPVHPEDGSARRSISND